MTSLSQVNNICHAPGQDVTWVQQLFSEFVDLRQEAAWQAANAGMQILPVLVLASTRAALASLEGSFSGKARIGDIALKPLSIRRMQDILKDLYNRIQAARKPPAFKGSKQLELALTWLSGNPRHLAWLLSSLSGRGVSDRQKVSIGQSSSHTFAACRWRRFDLEEKAVKDNSL